MSYRDDLLGISTTSANGRFQAATGERVEAFVPELHVGKRALLQAFTDLTRYCHYGLITVDGECKPWPCTIKVNKDGHRMTRFMMINGSRDPNEHRKLEDFFLGGYGQQLCDWIGFKYPCADAFWRIVKREGAKR